MTYFDNSPFKTNKIKDLFINSDTRNTNNSDEYLSVVRDVGVLSIPKGVTVVTRHQIVQKNTKWSV